MTAGYSNAALRPSEVPELSAFLTRGFGLSAGAESMSPDVLRWKYLGPGGPAQQPRSLIARAGGSIIGHVGFCPRSFVVRGEAPREIATTHPIDWLASPDHPTVGLTLLLSGCRSAPTQYSVGGTPVAQKVLGTLGFEPRCPVPIFRKVLRPIHRRLASGQGTLRTTLGALRDVLHASWHRAQPPRRPVELAPVEAFGAEVEAVVGRWSEPLVFSSRSAELLEHYLRFPGGNWSGWLVRDGGEVVGFALLNVVQDGRHRQGRIAECFLDRPEEPLWHAALFALLDVLRGQKADEVTCFGSTPWMAQALRKNGFVQVETTTLLVRDKKDLLPRSAPYHVTQLEADHAYLQ
jgi:hypothetical protein